SDPKLVFYMTAGLLNCFFLIGASSYAIYIIFTYYNTASGLGSLLFLIPLSVETTVFLLMGIVQNWKRLHKRIAPLMGIFCIFIIGIALKDALGMFLALAVVFVILIAVFNQAYDTQFLQYVKNLPPTDTDTDLTGIYRTVQTFGLLADNLWIFAPCILFLVVCVGIETWYWKLSHQRRIDDFHQFRKDIKWIKSYSPANLKNSLKIETLWVNRAREYSRSKRITLAIKCYRKAASLNPEVADFWYELGNCYYIKRQYLRAIYCFRTCVSLVPGIKISLDALGKTYIKIKKFNSAIICLQKSLTTYSRDATSWVLMGRAYCGKKDYEQAILCYKRALNYNMQYSPAWFYMWQAYNNSGNLEQAGDCLDYARKIEPQIYQRLRTRDLVVKQMRKTV
ncbi:MAG: tetratricopeptide repeat protein, partial [Promethearchaeota archaeon]